MKSLLENVKELFKLDGYDCSPVNEHEGGRNLVYICSKDGEKQYVLRISGLGDRSEEEYLAETREQFANTWTAHDGETVTMRYPRGEEKAWISLC